MLNTEQFPFEHIILDACCIVTLYASKQMDAILESLLPIKVAVVQEVLTGEALWVYNGPPDDVKREKKSIDITNLIDRQLIKAVNLSDDEMATYIDYVAELEDDGESYTGEIAKHRNWAIATDDHAALTFFERNSPDILLVTTPDLVKHWVDTNKPTAVQLRETLLNIQTRGIYRPSRKSPLRGWWLACVQET